MAMTTMRAGCAGVWFPASGERPTRIGMAATQNAVEDVGVQSNEKSQGKGWLSLIVSFALTGLALFLLAGTIKCWQGWVCLGIAAVSSAALTLYIANDPTLLEAGPTAEQQLAQKIIVLVAGLAGIVTSPAGARSSFRLVERAAVALHGMRSSDTDEHPDGISGIQRKLFRLRHGRNRQGPKGPFAATAPGVFLYYPGNVKSCPNSAHSSSTSNTGAPMRRAAQGSLSSPKACSRPNCRRKPLCHSIGDRSAGAWVGERLGSLLGLAADFRLRRLDVFIETYSVQHWLLARYLPPIVGKIFHFD